MNLDRILWKNSFDTSNIPKWTCPTCEKGTLTGNVDDFIINEGSLSLSYHKMEEWEPEWISGRFTGQLICENVLCREKVAIIGLMEVQCEQVEIRAEYYDYISTEALTPELFIPGLKVFKLLEGIPENIAQQTKDAFYLYWVDSSACANKIRSVVELILNFFKIKKMFITKKGKTMKLTLHARIDFASEKFPDVSKMLMAVKWIGNSGSHSNRILSKDDTLDGFEILEQVFQKLFTSDYKRILKLSKAIIKKKGPITKRR